MSAPRVSCIIAAYNEGPRLAAVLQAAVGHPELLEVIVVDDGSTDETLTVARSYLAVTAIPLSHNQGKSRAVFKGVLASRGEVLLMLDADLSGLTPEAISDLLQPVLSGEAVMSLSLKANAYPLEKLLGLEFITGERCFHRSLLGDPQTLLGLDGWAIESYLNTRALALGGPLRVVAWPKVTQARKSQKRGGFIRGVRGDLLAWRQIIRYQGILGVLRVFLRMRRSAGLRASGQR